MMYMTFSKKDARLWWIFLAWSVIGMLIVILILLAVVLSWLIYSKDRVLSGVMMTGVLVEYMTKDEIITVFRNKISETNRKIILMDGEHKWEYDWLELGFSPDIQTSAEQAVNWGKRLPTLLSLVQLVNGKVELQLKYNFDEKQINSLVDNIAVEIFTVAQNPDVQVTEQGQITVTQGTKGRSVNSSKLINEIKDKLINLDNNNLIQIEVIEDDRRVPEEILERTKLRASKWIDKKVRLEFDDQSLDWDGKFVAGLVGARTVFDEEKFASASEMLANAIYREPRDAVFSFEEENKKVKEFKEEKDGLSLKSEEFKSVATRELILLENASTNSATISVPVISTKPKISVKDINNLGINERIGRGESYFKGSINSRMHNIEVASSRLNGIIVAPGEEFSFIKSVGEISQKTGYQQAYVILNGQTVLGDGGGVCQVSSTIFRTVLNTGLDITKRSPHSYRVAYYEQKAFPGLDATIYPPSVDFKFVNDTPAHILIQTEFDKKNAHLIIDFFGTSDGRIAEISNNRMWDISSPPPDLYVDDPTLPVGVVKQQEHRINGAKAAFDWKVTRNREVLFDKTFLSVYRPWQAVYLRGTKIN